MLLKLIFLPGLDGTGEMFSQILGAFAGYETQIISLPKSGAQDYNSLTSYVSERLPDEDCILIAESFSGPIAADLGSRGHSKIKGVVFVATFLSPPQKFLLAISKAMPLKLMARLPFATEAHRFLFLGKNANDELVKLFQQTISDLDTSLIRNRIGSIEALDLNICESEIPALYLQATNDKLVPESNSLEFRKFFIRLNIRQIEGPHFLLQTNPQDCADEIAKFITSIPLN